MNIDFVCILNEIYFAALADVHTLSCNARANSVQKSYIIALYGVCYPDLFCKSENSFCNGQFAAPDAFYLHAESYAAKLEFYGFRIEKAAAD